MEYVINLIQSHLNEELRQLQISKEITAGNGMRFSKETMAAFDESRRLAEERIPQLKLALERISIGETRPNEIFEMVWNPISEHCTLCGEGGKYLQTPCDHPYDCPNWQPKENFKSK